MPENTPSEPANHGTSKSRSQSRRSSSFGKRLRLERLTLENFKAFDNLTIDFPRPNLENDPDILVMGSKNGLGKTSILDACSLLFLSASGGEKALDYLSHPTRITFELLDIMIRSDSRISHISGTFSIDGETMDLGLTLTRDGKVTTKGDSTAIRQINKSTKSSQRDTGNIALRFFLALAGLNSEPLLSPPFMYFHSYRKVQEGRLELGAMVEEERFLPRSRYPLERETPISLFKLEVLRSLMSRGSLFEDFDNKDAEDVLIVLNTLMKQYAGGRIDKLRPSADSRIEIRVTPINNPTASFNFDGLSSGQKEIISTLFLIWHYTRAQAGIVLIDEPELHLNPEWHRGFIQHLQELSPQNQYIIATHSEDVFSAVEKDRRILLTPNVEGQASPHIGRTDL